MYAILFFNSKHFYRITMLTTLKKANSVFTEKDVQNMYGSLLK